MPARRRPLHAVALTLALGAPAAAQERGSWPEVALDPDLAAAEAWVEPEAPPRFVVQSARAGAWRIEVVLDRELATANARAVAPDGRLAWSFPGPRDACERVEVVHVGAAGGWHDDRSPGACVVLRADRGGHAGGTALVLRLAGGVEEVARIDLGAGGLEVRARPGDAPPDLCARDEALAGWTTSTADAPRALLRWRWDGAAYTCAVSDEATTLAASAAATEEPPARGRRLGQIAEALYRGDVAGAAELARSADRRGLQADGFESAAAWWRAILERLRAGSAWPALVRADPRLAEVPEDLGAIRPR